MGTLIGDIRRQNGRKVLVSAFSLTASAQIFALPATTTELALKIPADALFVLVPTVACNYRFAKSGAVAGATATNSTPIAALSQEYSFKASDDVSIDAIGAVGTLMVFISLPGPA